MGVQDALREMVGRLGFRQCHGDPPGARDVVLALGDVADVSHGSAGSVPGGRRCRLRGGMSGGAAGDKDSRGHKGAAGGTRDHLDQA